MNMTININEIGGANRLSGFGKIHPVGRSQGAFGAVLENAIRGTAGESAKPKPVSVSQNIDMEIEIKQLNLLNLDGNLRTMVIDNIKEKGMAADEAVYQAKKITGVFSVVS